MMDLELEQLSNGVREVIHDIPSRLLLQMSRLGESRRAVFTTASSEPGNDSRYRIDICGKGMLVWQNRPLFFNEQVCSRRVLVAKKVFGGGLEIYGNPYDYSVADLRNNSLTSRVLLIANRKDVPLHGDLHVAQARESYSSHHP